MDILEELIISYNNKRYKYLSTVPECKFYYYLSNNPNLQLKLISKYVDKPWSWRGISSNPNLQLD